MSWLVGVADAWEKSQRAGKEVELAGYKNNNKKYICFYQLSWFHTRESVVSPPNFNKNKLLLNNI